MEETCCLEEKAVADGLEAGKKRGVELGRQDGRNLGVQKGLELGNELGFMLGCITAMQTYAERSPELVSPKHLAMAAEIKSLINAFPTHPQDPELQDKFNHLRSRFKVLVAGVKLLQDPERDSHKNLDF